MRSGSGSLPPLRSEQRMLHDAVRRALPVSQREYRFPRQPEIELHDQVTAVARHPPRSGRFRLAARRGSGGRHDCLRGIAHGGKLRAGGAAARLASPLEPPRTCRLRQIRGAHVPPAVSARRPMPRARALPADRTLAHTGERERLAVHVALLAVLRAARSEEHTSELQSQSNLVCRLLLEKKKRTNEYTKFSLHSSLSRACL